jgi:hypothetical protein
MDQQAARRRLLALVEQQALEIYSHMTKTPELPCLAAQGLPCKRCDQCPRAR